jgi:hypothetical protein
MLLNKRKAYRLSYVHIMLPPHIAEPSPRDLDSGCVELAECPRPRATNVRNSGRVRATMRLMSVFLFRIKGRSCPNKREHDGPDYTSRAAQSHLSGQSEQFSCVVGLIVVKLEVNYSQCRIGVMNWY